MSEQIIIDRFSFASYAARAVDNLIYEGNRGGKVYSILCESIAARFISTVVFPIFASFDVVLHTLNMCSELLQAIDPDKRKIHLIEAYDRLCLAVKSLFCAVFSPIALVSFVDIFTQDFLANNVNAPWTQPYGKMYKSLVEERVPESIEEIEKIVSEAHANNKKIGIAGARMSQGMQTLPVGEGNVYLNMKKMNKIEIDPDEKVAKVQAGATWRDLQVAANQHGLAVQVMQASNVFSIGGSLSINCHGWDHHAGQLSNVIRSLTIVDADGITQKVYPGDPLFKHAIGGLGLFGVIVEAEIELTENKEMVQWGEVIPIEEYVDYFDKNILGDENLGLHRFRLSIDRKDFLLKGIASNYTNHENKVVSKLKDEAPNGNFFERIALHLALRRSYARKLFWFVESNRLKERITSRNEVMRPPIKAAFNNSQAYADWLQEYFVQPKDLVPFLHKLRKVLQDNDVPVINATVRYVRKEDTAELAYAPDGRRFAIVLFFNQSLAPEKIEKTRNWVREICDWLIERHGTFYLPYAHLATKEQFQAAYSNWDDVARVKRCFDPDEVFCTGFYKDYLQEEVS
jgi:FAD/FMN-containing dehydrogenase